MIKHNGYYITSTPDVEENAGGRFYQVYSDESCDNEVDNFCLSREQLADEDKLVRQYVDKLADDTGVYVYQNNEKEVLEKIRGEHDPSEWQNNNW